ncbi:sensor histidine kinase [Bifidobacterium vespertilionis]|uniref:histidine kinase n=1 Tax=Bifidobacterium vespertilionis TaxID=2562524 RepID=A0A5J5E5P8_9BIFI|nr:HAMP domain-containing sensor histidine kinase [Bifidobacterium vespertilionis]KAA8822430.1 HAMP domain-containing histidine kinase [Bifidobacterium vespertilionis]KAA8824508.1 HAMP domain-containing histidine kinase [Bifidobacterium vespertilionis]
MTKPNGTAAPASAPANAQAPASAERAPRMLFEKVPLSTKLVVIIFVLLFTGTGTITFAIRQMVSGYLIDRLDNQLQSQAQMVVNNIDKFSQQDPTNSLGMTNYFIQIRDSNNEIKILRDASGNMAAATSIPKLKYDIVSTPLLPVSGSSGNVSLGTVFTTPAYVELPDSLRSVSSDKLTNEQREVIANANASWRVAALRWVDDTNGQYGVLYIGLSMGDQMSTVQTITEYCLMVGVAIVVLGVSIGSLVVSHTLKPLKRIEKTAAKIAAGDLSQRVPAMPENTEVGSLSASLNAMLYRIESSFHEQEATTEKMKRFVSDASHELRTPLAAIHGYAELYKMQREYPGALERADEAIGHIEKSSTRMTVLVEDLLSLARLDEGRGIDLTQQVNLTSIVSDATEDLHALDPDRVIGTGRVTLSAVLPQGAPENARKVPCLAFTAGNLPDIHLTGDTSRLRQVITNIIGNVHRYTPGDSAVQVAMGTLTASITPNTLGRMPSTDASLSRFIEAVQVAQGTQTGHDYAVVQVVDHGPGVPADKRSQVFERFYTADPSRAREKGGTGLGLSIAQSVTKAHKGLICATETPGGGLTFTIVLPLGTVSEPPADRTQPMKTKKSGWSLGKKAAAQQPQAPAQGEVVPAPAASAASSANRTAQPRQAGPGGDTSAPITPLS